MLLERRVRLTHEVDVNVAALRELGEDHLLGACVAVVPLAVQHVRELRQERRVVPLEQQRVVCNLSELREGVLENGF